MRKNANNSQRFLAYFVDFLIIDAIVSTIAALAFTIMKFDTSVNDLILEKLMEEAINAVETGYFTDYLNYYIEFLKYSLVEIGVQTACAFVAFIGYLVILPKFWKKQTVGRLISKTKVVMLDGSNPTTKAIIIREVVGSFLLYYCFGLIPLVISWVFLNKYQRSLADRISGTKLIFDAEVIIISGDNDNQNSNDYIDAKFVDIEEKPNPKKPEPEADEDGYIVF
jgi:uncharacterized RDD family membrane protein YckC